MLVTVALIVLALGAWWSAGRARKRARGELDMRAFSRPLAAAVDESLDDLRAEPDPRRAVIAAYARLERVLAAHGLPRGRGGAARVPRADAGDLSVRPDAAEAHRLFERANSRSMLSAPR